MIITLQNEFLTAKVNTLGGAIESLMENGTEHIWPYDAERWPRRTSRWTPSTPWASPTARGWWGRC